MYEVVEVSFGKDTDWIFKLKDKNDSVLYIMEDHFYKNCGIKPFLEKSHLDSVDIGTTISGEINSIENIKVVTSIHRII